MTSLDDLKAIEAAIAPLRERAVLGEAVVQAVLDTMNVWTPPRVKEAVDRWLEKFPQ